MIHITSKNVTNINVKSFFFSPKYNSDLNLNCVVRTGNIYSVEVKNKLDF